MPRGPRVDGGRCRCGAHEASPGGWGPWAARPLDIASSAAIFSCERRGAKMHITRRGLIAGSAVAAVGLARADEPAWAAFAEPGTVGLMRHALAPGTGDPARFRLGDCSTQRNLDDRGRAQSRAIGAEIRARGITIDRVLTSQWCRCRETADLLGIGPVEDFPPLNSFFRDRSTRDAQTEAVLAHLRALDPDTKPLLVTHQVNVTALTGRGVSSGELFVIRIEKDDRLRVLGEILIRA